MAPRIPLSPGSLQCGQCIGRRLSAEVTAKTTQRKLAPAAKSHFSTTTALDARVATTITKQRRQMFMWLQRMRFLKHLPERLEDQEKNPQNYKQAGRRKSEDDDMEAEAEEAASSGGFKGGAQLKPPLANELVKTPVYLTGDSKRPFIMNQNFESASVLDDESRERIWSDVIDRGEAIKHVSVKYGVDIRRVAAVVRLKQVEKDWMEKKKPMATKYAKAVMSVLPTWKVRNASKPFESIHDVTVHRYTMQQLFWPVAESKRFTREDAAKAFHPTLLPADKRVPVPELVELEKGRLKGTPPAELLNTFVGSVKEHEKTLADWRARAAKKAAAKITKVDSDRFEFRFQTFEVEDVGKTGRAKRGTGWRYGVPLYDRQRGHSREVPETVGLGTEYWAVGQTGGRSKRHD